MASILDTLQAELRRVMIAGANAAAEDTKLSKLAQDLKAAGGKAPVLTRLAEQTEALISQSGTKSTILLDEAVLVASIATTQAATDRKGDLNLSEAENDLIFVKRSYRDTKALINALTTKGGGRQSIIQNELGSGTAYDSRLLPLFVGALDDSYSEIANDIAKGLSKFGRQAIEPLKAVIDISKGTDSSIRKLEALASLLNNDEKEALFMDIYTNGNSKLKPLAIRNLTDIKHDEIHKTALKSKNDQIREAAFYALAARQDEEAAQILADALATKDYAMAVEAADAHKHQKTLDLYKAMVEEMIDSDAPLTKETTHRIGVYQTHTNGGYEVLLKIYRYYNNREKWLVFDNYADSYYSNYIAGALRSMLYIDAERALADIAAMTDEEGIPDNTYSYMVRYGLEQLTPDKLYTALEPFLEHERLKNSLISEFEYCLNVQRYLRISLKEVKNEQPEKPIDKRFLPYIQKAPWLVARMMRPDKEYKAYFDGIIKQDFISLDGLSMLYWYAYAQVIMGEKDFISAVADVLEKSFSKTLKMYDSDDEIPYWNQNFKDGNEKLIQALQQHLEDPSIWNDISWLVRIMELALERFVDMFEKMRKNSIYTKMQMEINSIIASVRYL